MPELSSEDGRLSSAPVEVDEALASTVAAHVRTELPSAERALVIGDDIGIFLAVARSLGRRGVEVHVAPTDWSAPGLVSRYVADVHRLPPYHAGPDAWAAALRTLVHRYRFRLILPCSDSSLLILSHHAADFDPEILALPNRQAMAAFTDKAETRALARRLDVPIAEGASITVATTAAGLARLGLPLVLKPRTSYALGNYRMKTSALIVRDPAGLEQALRTTPTDGWFAEAFFHGEGVGLSVLSERGRILHAWQHRRLRAWSEAGASTVRTAEPPDPRLVAHVERLAEATGLSGVAMFEFRREPASGAHILLEVNPRFWGSLPLAVAAGADFPAMLWDARTGGASAVVPVRRTGITKRNMTGEIDRLASEIRDAQAAGKLRSLASMIGFCATLALRARFDSWSPDDPAPFHAERRQILRKLVRGMAARLPLSILRR